MSSTVEAVRVTVSLPVCDSVTVSLPVCPVLLRQCMPRLGEGRVDAYLLFDTYVYERACVCPEPVQPGDADGQQARQVAAEHSVQRTLVDGQLLLQRTDALNIPFIRVERFIDASIYRYTFPAIRIAIFIL